MEQGNFDGCQMLRVTEMPKIEVHIVPNDQPSSGIGEPGTPPIAPAVCNAILVAISKCIRRLPIRPGRACVMGSINKTTESVLSFPVKPGLLVSVSGSQEGGPFAYTVRCPWTRNIS